jgi:hypothetical protein
MIEAVFDLFFVTATGFGESHSNKTCKWNLNL